MGRGKRREQLPPFPKNKEKKKTHTEIFLFSLAKKLEGGSSSLLPSGSRTRWWTGRSTQSGLHVVDDRIIGHYRHRELQYMWSSLLQWHMLTSPESKNKCLLNHRESDPTNLMVFTWTQSPEQPSNTHKSNSLLLLEALACIDILFQLFLSTRLLLPRWNHSAEVQML